MPGNAHSQYSTNEENWPAVLSTLRGSAIPNQPSLSKIETVPNVGVPFSPWLPAIHPFLQFTAPLPSRPPPSPFPLPSGGGINYTVARDRTRPFKFRLFPADAEIELGIGAAEWSADDEGASERRIHTSEDKLKVLRGCKNS